MGRIARSPILTGRDPHGPRRLSDCFRGAEWRVGSTTAVGAFRGMAAATVTAAARYRVCAVPPSLALQHTAGDRARSQWRLTATPIMPRARRSAPPAAAQQGQATVQGGKLTVIGVSKRFCFFWHHARLDSQLFKFKIAVAVLQRLEIAGRPSWTPATAFLSEHPM